MSEEGWLFVGIDWATQTHQVTVLDHVGKVLAERSIVHTAEGLAALCQWLGSFGVALADVRIAIEVPHGAVVESLLERELAVFSINPRQLDRFRDRFSMSGAKDDRRDALVLADSLRTDAHCFRRLSLSPEPMIILREWSRMAEDLGIEHSRLAGRLREQLLRYYPQFLRAVGDPTQEWAMALWERLPSPSKVSGRSRSAIAAILGSHRIRRVQAEELLEILHEPALRVAPGTEQAARNHIAQLLERLRVVERQRRECRHKLQETIEDLGASDEPNESREQHDATILLSMPGVGWTVCALLLAEAHRPLAARDYQALRALAGVAPITRRSGKGRPAVEMRRGCNPRLRNGMYHLARTAVLHDERCRARYSALRARGHSHGRALRSVADRILAVLVAMLRTRTAYQPRTA